MNVLQRIGNYIAKTEFVSRKLKRYREDADYRYNLQEEIVMTTVTAAGFMAFFGGIVYLAYKLSPSDEAIFAMSTMTAGAAVSTVDEGLTLSAELLEAIAVEGRHFFETPVGMYVVEYYSDLPAFV